jgi:hypothetical protein
MEYQSVLKIENSLGSIEILKPKEKSTANEKEDFYQFIADLLIQDHKENELKVKKQLVSN